MDGASGIQSHEERGAEKLMDDYLRSLDLHRKKVAKDGSCLFRAVAEQVLHCQSLHTEVRAQCVEFLRNNRKTYEAFIEGDFENYLLMLQDPQQWVGEVEINALAIMYKRDFLIFQEPGKPAVNITSNNFKETVMLCFLNGNHYDSVYPISRLKNAALCQSILYELLYEGVFKVDHSVLAQCQRAGKNDVLSDDTLPLCGSSDESDNETGEALWVESEVPAAPKHKGRGQRGTQLPERVRRSLKPTLFRNIDYDIWHKTKRAQQKMDYHIAAGMQFSVGDRCKVCLDGSGQGYTATIKHLTSDDSLVTVHSEEFGQNEVPLWSLRPSTSDAKSWSTVVNRERRISNGHGDWEDRGRGRGRGKHVQATALLIPTTALGSNGRVMKQQSWPSSAAGDGQGGGKPRRSISTVDSTNEQRSAKKKEEQITTPVDFELRDEDSFPALGTPTLADTGRKRAVDKKRAQRTKTKSPVEDIQPATPSEGRPPRPAFPGPPSTLSAAPPTNGAPSESSAVAASVATQPIKPSYALTANQPTSAPTAASAAKPSAAGGAVPLSIQSPTSPVSFLTPVLPVASSPPTSSALSSSSPPASSSSISAFPVKPVASPTFIAPIAPVSPQGFLPGGSAALHPLPSSSSHHPFSPAMSFSSSSSSVHPAAQVHGASSISTQTPNVKVTPASSQTLQIHSERSSVGPGQSREDPQPSAPPSRSMTHHAQPQAPVFQSQPSSHASPVASHHHLQHTAQCTATSTGAQQLHPSVFSSHQSASSTQLPVHAHNHSEESLAPSNPQSHPHVAPQEPPVAPSHPPPPPPPPLAPYPQSFPGVVPLQQLYQLYQDPLYPGFPQGEKGSVAPIPPFSSCKSGEDLPQDKNVLRFFYNLGVKAYSMPMYAPYIYLLPLQQTHTMNPRGPSRSPSPTPLPNYSSISHHVQQQQQQEPYHQQSYPPPPVPAHFEQAAIAPLHNEAFHQTRYQVMEPLQQQQQQQQQQLPSPSLSWQQLQQQQQQMPPANTSSFPVSYPSSTPHYPIPQQVPQGYLPRHPLYPGDVPTYPHTALAYQPSPATVHEEPQVNVEMVERKQHLGGAADTLAAGLVAGCSRATLLPPFVVKKDPSESASTVLLVDPTLNRKPMLVSNTVMKDVPVTMKTVSSSSPGSPLRHDTLSKGGYQGHQPQLHPANTYTLVRGPEQSLVGFLPAAAAASAATAAPTSVGCNTTDDWEEEAHDKPPRVNQQGARRGYRGGGRWRGSYDPDRRSSRKRCEGDAGPPSSYSHYSSSHRGRGRGY